MWNRAGNRAALLRSVLMPHMFSAVSDIAALSEHALALQVQRCVRGYVKAAGTARATSDSHSIPVSGAVPLCFPSSACLQWHQPRPSAPSELAAGAAVPALPAACVR
jgi:hypothetical protein